MCCVCTRTDQSIDDRRERTQYMSKTILFGKIRTYLNSKRITPVFIIGSVILLVFLFTGIFGPCIAACDPEEMHYEHLKEKPSRTFPLGTDRFGRDVLSRVIRGARTTLLIAAASVCLEIIEKVYKTS